MSDQDTLRVVEEFNRAWGAHDLAAALSLVTEDCVFENTSPAPDGRVFRGRDEVAAAWKEIFDNPRSVFEAEDTFAAGDRAVQLWRYSWGDGHVRGVDVMRVRDGKVAEKFSYVKG